MVQKSFIRTFALCSTTMAALVTGCANERTAPDTGTSSHVYNDMYFPPQAKNQAPAPAPAPKPAPAPAPVKTGCNTSMAYPTGDKATSALWLEKSMPCVVNCGQNFEYMIKVTNLTSLTLENVTVTDNITNIKVASAEPAAANTNGTVSVWNLGSMAGGTTKTIKITGSPINCAQGMNACASVTYSNLLCIDGKVVTPGLKLAKTITPEATPCDPIVVKLVVTNPGTGDARNVKIKDTLPAGMTADGKSTVEFEVGTLAAGQSAERSFTAKAEKIGSYDNKAMAMADGGLTADAAASTVVKQAVLAIAQECPANVIAAGGRQINYCITVTNTGDAPAAMTMVEDAVPAGTSFVSATEGGTLQGNNVVWNVGTLAPKASKKVCFTVNPTAMGTVNNTAMAKANCAAPVNASCKTEVRGIPGVLIEVVDEPDPVQVGGMSTYTVTVTNQGQIDLTNIKVKGSFEDTAAFGSGSGDSAVTSTGQNISFGSIAKLASKGKVTWKFTLKAVKSDDHRLSIEMICDQIKSSVNETESTTFFE